MDTATLEYRHSHSYAGIGQATGPIETDAPTETPSKETKTGFWGNDGFSFGDLLDLINPLQHIPVVSTLYRAITNDEIAPGPRLAGGALFGGPLGFISALANTFVEESTGRDVGEHIVALAGFGQDDGDPDAAPGSDAPVVAAKSPTDGSATTPTQVAAVAATSASNTPIPAPQVAPIAAANAQPATHSVRPAALAKYETTAWGALLATQQSGGAIHQQLREPLPMPASALTRRANAGGQATPVNALAATSASASWQVEHLTAQQLAERLLAYSKSLDTTGKSRKESADQAY